MNWKTLWGNASATMNNLHQTAKKCLLSFIMSVVIFFSFTLLLIIIPYNKFTSFKNYFLSVGTAMGMALYLEKVTLESNGWA